MGSKTSGRELERREGRGREDAGRRDPPRDAKLEEAEYIPLPPSPPSWGMGGRFDPQREYEDPALEPVFSASLERKHEKVIRLGASLTAGQREGLAGEVIAKAYRQVIGKRRAGGQLMAAAKWCVDMFECVPTHASDRDKRRFNEILSELRKKQIHHDYTPIKLLPPAEPQPLFEISAAADWSLVDERKLQKHERPDPAFKRVIFSSDGVLLVDETGKSELAEGAPAAIRKLDKRGVKIAERALSHDVYRLGAGPMSSSCAIMDSSGHLHVYDASLKLVIEKDLQRDSRVVDHFRAIETNYWGEFRTQVRAVDVSPDGSKYLFTIADEAWCCLLDSRSSWGVRLPLNEGWERIVSRSERHGPAAQVEEALQTLGLALPVAAADIKRRYRELALNHHPDRHPTDADAGRKMQEFNDAVRTLTGVDPASLELGESDVTYFRRTRPDYIVSVGPIDLEVTLPTGQPQDWVYGASFAARDGRSYLASYSGKVVEVSGEGGVLRVYDLGAIAEEIVDTGEFLYFLTATRLYVLDAAARLRSVVDVYGQGRLVVTQRGFGLLSRKTFQWFSPSGEKIGGVATRDPVRGVYASSEGAVIETRQHRAIIPQLDLS